MRIFQKATVYAYKEIPDNLSKEEIEELKDQLEGDLNLDLDNLGYGGNSDYKFVHSSENISEKEMQKESFEYKELLEDEMDLDGGMIKYNGVLMSDPEATKIGLYTGHFLDCEIARYAYKKCLEKSKFSKMINNDDINLLQILDKTCLIDAQAVIYLTQKHNDKKYGLDEAKELVKEISPVWGLRNANCHPRGQLGYYDDVENAIYKIVTEHKNKKDNKNRGNGR